MSGDIPNSLGSPGSVFTAMAQPDDNPVTGTEFTPAEASAPTLDSRSANAQEGNSNALEFLAKEHSGMMTDHLDLSDAASLAQVNKNLNKFVNDNTGLSKMTGRRTIQSPDGSRLSLWTTQEKGATRVDGLPAARVFSQRSIKGDETARFPHLTENAIDSKTGKVTDPHLTDVAQMKNEMSIKDAGMDLVGKMLPTKVRAPLKNNQDGSSTVESFDGTSSPLIRTPSGYAQSNSNMRKAMKGTLDPKFYVRLTHEQENQTLEDVQRLRVGSTVTGADRPTDETAGSGSPSRSAPLPVGNPPREQAPLRAQVPPKPQASSRSQASSRAQASSRSQTPSSSKNPSRAQAPSRVQTTSKSQATASTTDTPSTMPDIFGI